MNEGRGGSWVISLSGSYGHRCGLRRPEYILGSILTTQYLNHLLDYVANLFSSQTSGAVEDNRAGRLLVWARSENGKGTTTTSPFTNLPKLYPPRG